MGARLFMETATHMGVLKSALGHLGVEMYVVPKIRVQFGTLNPKT